MQRAVASLRSAAAAAAAASSPSASASASVRRAAAVSAASGQVRSALAVAAAWRIGGGGAPSRGMHWRSAHGAQYQRAPVFTRTAATATMPQQHSEQRPMHCAAAAGAAGATTTAASAPAVSASATTGTSTAPVVDAANGAGAGTGGGFDVPVPEVELTSFAPALNPDNPLTMLPELMQEGLLWLHNTTALPWWGCIMLLTVTARTLLFPLAISQFRASAGQQLAQPELHALDDEFAKVQAAYAKVGQMVPMHVNAEQQARRSAIMKKNGASLMGTLKMALVQVPLFMSFFWGMRSMAHVDPSFCWGGVQLGPFDWTNLAELDPTYVLPFVNAAVQLTVARLNSENAPANMKKFTYAMVAFSLLFTVTQVPVGVLVYWITQNIFIVIQGQILRQESVKKRFNIPIINLTPEQKAENAARQAAQMSKLMDMFKGNKGKSTAASAAPATVSHAPSSNPFAMRGATPSPEASAAAAEALSSKGTSKAAAFYGAAGASTAGGAGGGRHQRGQTQQRPTKKR
jgi:YidC/Oxa1 family membrane protein insertase